MSERYQVIIKAGEHTFHFKTKTRVGEFWNFAEEMKEHTDWENMAIAFKQRNDEALKAESCPECSARTQHTYIEGEFLVPPSDKAGVITACTRCKWLKVEKL